MSKKPKNEKIYKCIRLAGKQWLIIAKEMHNGKCDCRDIADCKTSIEKCNFDKRTCHKTRNKRNGNREFPWGQVTLVIGVALLIILYLTNKGCSKPIPEPLMDILTGLLVSIIAAGLFTFIIDMRSRLRENMQNVVEAITDYSYLKELDEKELTKLRERVTHELHTKDTPNAAEALVHIDEKICKLLKRPYYERYEHTTVCDIYSENQNFREKHITIYYELINPCGEHRPTWEYIGFRVFVFKDETISNPIRDITIECDIDGQGNKNYTDEIQSPVLVPLGKTDGYYNHSVTLQQKGASFVDPDSIKNGIKLDYKHNIKVTISYTLVTPKEDNCFSKFMRYPTKALSVDYTDRSPNVELLGHMIGMELEYPDGKMRYKKPGDKSSLTLKSHDKWLLPNEGVFIVTSPQKEA